MASVDDIEELIATRKLNGVNDNLYRDGTGINVGSIEEDIKVLEKMLETLEELFQLTKINNTKERNALRNLLTYYKRQKQINEEHQKVNGELREKVKELEKENHMFKDNNVLVSRYFKLKDNSIPKQKVKDLKESIKLEPVIVGGRRNRKTLEYGIKLGKIKACEELLEEDK